MPARDGAAARRRAAAARVPRGVVAALAGEIAPLADPARRVWRRAPRSPATRSTLGTPAAAGGLAEASLAALDALLAADLVRPRTPRRFRFRHPLVRRAVYESARRRLAARRARARRRRAGGARRDAAERAHHVERAAQPGDLAAVDAARPGRPSRPRRRRRRPRRAGTRRRSRLLPERTEHDGRRLELLPHRPFALASAGRPVEARTCSAACSRCFRADAARAASTSSSTLAELEAALDQHAERRAGCSTPSAAALGEGRRPSPPPSRWPGGASGRARRPRGGRGARRRGARGRPQRGRRARSRPRRRPRAADAAQCRLRGDDPAALAAVDAKIAAAGRWSPPCRTSRWPAAAHAAVAGARAPLHRATRGPREAARARARAGARDGPGPARAGVRVLRGFVDQELGLARRRRGRRGGGARERAALRQRPGRLLGVDRSQRDRAGARRRRRRARRTARRVGAARRDAVLAGRVHASPTRGWRPATRRARSAALEAFGWVRPQLWTLDRVKAAGGRGAGAARARPRRRGGGVRRRRAGRERRPAAPASSARSWRAPQAPCCSPATGRPRRRRRRRRGAAAADAGDAPLWAGRCRTLAGEALAGGGRPAEAPRASCAAPPPTRRPRRVGLPRRRRSACCAGSASGRARAARRAAAADGGRARGR